MVHCKSPWVKWWLLEMSSTSYTWLGPGSRQYVKGLMKYMRCGYFCSWTLSRGCHGVIILQKKTSVYLCLSALDADTNDQETRHHNRNVRSLDLRVNTWWELQGTWQALHFPSSGTKRTASWECNFAPQESSVWAITSLLEKCCSISDYNSLTGECLNYVQSSQLAWVKVMGSGAAQCETAAGQCFLVDTMVKVH